MRSGNSPAHVRQLKTKLARHITTCHQTMLDLLLYVGAAFAAVKLGSLFFSIFSSIYALFLRPRVNVAKYGKWAGEQEHHCTCA
jgi:hypothetical protein